MSADHDSFLLALSDALRPLADAVEVQAVACRLLGEHLGVDRALYAEVEEEHIVIPRGYTATGVAPMVGRFPRAAYGSAIVAAAERGEPLVTSDVPNDERFTPAERAAYAAIGAAAYISMPLVKDGRWVAALGVNHTTPRGWTSAEVALCRETAERTWAAVERAKAEAALAAEKEYAESIVETLHEPLLVLHPDLTVKGVNAAFYTHFRVDPADTIGRKVYDLGNRQWDIPALRTLLEDVLPDSNVFNDYEVTHDFEGLGRRVMLVNARWLDHVQFILLGIRDITERARAEETLRESEAKYRTLFETMGQGYALCELVRDGGGRATDLRYLEVNPAFRTLTGIDLAVVGRRLSEVLPGVEPFWLETYTRVVDTDQPTRFERELPELGRWLDVAAYPRGGDRFAALFDDVTERKRREADLAFLAGVSLDLERLTSIDATMNPLGAKIAAYLGLSACVFAELFGENEAQTAELTHGWHRADVSSLLGTYQMSEYMTLEMIQMCRAENSIIIRDVFADPKTDGERFAALNIGSFIGVPFLRDGEWKFLLVVYRSEPHDWSEDEIALVRELTTRIWTRLERARAEVALRDSEARLQLALGAAELGTFVWHVAEDRTEADARALAHFGLPPDATTNLAAALARIFHPEDGPRYVQAVERAADPSGPGTLHEEFRIRWPDGRERWMAVRAATAFEGTPPAAVRMTGILSDVTDRKRAEAAVRASEDRLRAVADNLPNAAVFVVGHDLRFQLAGGQALTAAGIAPAEYTGREVGEPLPPGAADEHRANYQRALAGESFRVEHVVGGRHFVTHGAPLRNSAGEVTAALAVSYDITDRVRAEEQARRAEHKLRLALTAARMGVWQWDVSADTHTRDANLNRLLGLEAVESRQPFAEFLSHVHPDDRAGVQAAFDGSVRHGHPLNTEFRVVWPDGAVRWLRDQGDVFMTAGQRYLFGACVDITVLKEAETALREAKGRLEERVTERTKELSAALDSLTAEMNRRRAAERDRQKLLGRVVSAQEDERRRVSRELHDSVGQLLTALGLAVREARERVMNPAAAAGLDDVQRVADELGKSVHELAVRLRPTALDDLGLAAALGQYLRGWFVRTGVAVEYDASAVERDRLPPDVETAFYRVIQEALTNVARHARATRVSVVIGRSGGHATAVVEDDGVGFDPDAVTGRLGLIGMRERLALLGGTLHIDSSEDGTAVIARVPLDGRAGHD